MNTRACEHCNEKFSLPRKRPKDKHIPKNFCSYSCRNKSRINPSKKGTYECEWCHNKFESWAYRPNRFCSRKCAASFGGSVGGRPKKDGYQVFKMCAFCGSQYLTDQGQIKHRGSAYCSKKCKYDAMSMLRCKENNPNWSGGTADPDAYGPNWNRQKRCAKKRDIKTCQVCGYRVGGNRYLDVHHIIPIKKFNGDWKKANELSNLISLCRPCHIKVEKGKIPCPTAN